VDISILNVSEQMMPTVEWIHVPTMVLHVRETPIV